MVKNYLKKNFSHKTTNRFLVLLLTVDLIFIMGHLTVGVVAHINPVFDWQSYEPILITTERGIPEYFQYLKFKLTILFFGFLILKYRLRNYLFWISLYILMFLDDAFQIHENMGLILAEKFSLGAFYNLRAQDIGELLYTAAVGSIILGIMLLSFINSNISFKKRSIDLALLLFIFLFFGVGVDLAHVLFRSNEYVSFLLGMLEDSGEMIVLSFISWYILFLAFFTESHNIHLYYIINKGYANRPKGKL